LVTFFEKVTNSQSEFPDFPQGFARAKREEKADEELAAKFIWKIGEIKYGSI